MEISLIADAVTIASAQALAFASCVLPRHHFPLHDSLPEHPFSAGSFQISAAISPVDAVAPPPVRPNRLKTIPRTFVRKKRRTRRRSLTDGGSEDGEDGGLFGDAGDGDGPFGGGGGGGSGWNFGWSNWDESSSATPPDPAFDFVYEVISWIALSNCLHFAFKKVVRIVADGVSDPAREKASIC